MYQIKAVLGNQAKPELGVVTVPFPIPRQEYEQILELLKGLEIGASVGQDCQVETIDSHYSILKRLEETMVNLDELDYLAKRLDSFDVYEALQFQAAAAAKDISSIRDFINLTFCCQQVTVVQDFRDLEKIGKDHVMALNGGCISMEESKRTDFRKRAQELLQNGEGRITLPELNILARRIVEMDEGQEAVLEGLVKMLPSPFARFFAMMNLLCCFLQHKHIPQF